jgi:hypothetical protein
MADTRRATAVRPRLKVVPRIALIDEPLEEGLRSIFQFLAHILVRFIGASVVQTGH